MASSDILQFLPLSIIMDAQKMTELSHIRFEEKCKKLEEGYKKAEEAYKKYRNNVIKNGGNNCDY